LGIWRGNTVEFEQVYEKGSIEFWQLAIECPDGYPQLNTAWKPKPLREGEQEL
jgi:hypothetical protein